MKKPAEIIYVNFRDFSRQVSQLCCDMPIKFRQVFVPLMSGVMDRSITILGCLRISNQKISKNQYEQLLRALTEWQVMLEMILDLHAVKEVRIGPLLEQSENLKNQIEGGIDSSN